jgi:hypothetical protein
LNPDDPPDPNPNTNQATERATPTSEYQAKRYRVSRKKPSDAAPAPLLLGAAAPLTSAVVSGQAHAEGLTLLVADNKSGYFGVYVAKPGQPKPYQAKLHRDGKTVHLGHFATAEEAALCVARSPERRAEVAKQAAAAATLTSEVVSGQAQAEGLTLLVADNKSGYFGVYVAKPGQPKPYQVKVHRDGKTVHLGSFATAEEAALCVARSPEGQAEVAKRAAEAATLTSEVVSSRRRRRS